MGDQKEEAMRRLKRQGYSPVGSDKYGVYLQNEDIMFYLDIIGVFIFRRRNPNLDWVRQAGYSYDFIPWEEL